MLNNGSYTGPERREAFRIDDQVELKYELISESSLALAHTSTKTVKKNPQKYLQFLQTLDPEIAHLSAGIKENYPLLDKYLSLLEQKIHLLSMTLELMTEVDHQPAPTELVNLSDTGLSFHTDQAISPKSPIKLNLVLQPSYTDLEVYGRVVYSQVTKNTPIKYRNGIQFVHISLSDQQALARHIISLQAQAKRSFNQDFEHFKV